ATMGTISQRQTHTGRGEGRMRMRDLTRGHKASGRKGYTDPEKSLRPPLTPSRWPRRPPRGGLLGPSAHRDRGGPHHGARLVREAIVIPARPAGVHVIGHGTGGERSEEHTSE